jgi:arabinofuranan 3-O-arabinosyltransferase
MRLTALLRHRSAEPAKLVFALALGLSLGYAGALACGFMLHIWITDTQGHPVVEDFVAFWTAGHQALKGMAVTVFNVPLEHAAEIATIGHPFGQTLGWSYPPAFLFVAGLLSLLPYTASFLLWDAVTLAAYAATIGVIVRRPAAVLVACAAPWMLTALMPGQNGFLTAALVGAALLSLEKRPALAGIFLGLGFAGYWRTFAWASATTIAVNLCAGAVFGFDTLGAFLHALSSTTQSHLSHAGLGWSKLQSIYGLVRSMGVPEGIGWAAQAAFSAVVAAAVVAYWRGDASFSLKAAVLGSAVPLVTPYVFVYDLPVLAVTCAFLFEQRSFDRTELWLMAATAPCIFAFLWVPFPTPFFASLAVAAMVVRRAVSQETSVQAAFAAAPLALARRTP